MQPKIKEDYSCVHRCKDNQNHFGDLSIHDKITYHKDTCYYESDYIDFEKFVFKYFHINTIKKVMYIYNKNYT